MTVLFITGTDTGVGKTHVACGLATGLAARGLAVGVCKPCETGVQRRRDELPSGSDAARLVAASGCEASQRDVLPYAFALPAAPSVAARAEGQAIDPRAVATAVSRLERAHDVVLVEGAGGLLVPLVERVTFLDLARAEGWPVLVVCRAGLGTLNHTALTVRAATGAGLSVLGVVINEAEGPLSDSDGSNLQDLPGLIDVPILAHLKHTPGATNGAVLPASLYAHLAGALGLE